MIHELKAFPVFFEPVRRGSKTFEVRSEKDRTFNPGDLILLREIDGMLYTGREVRLLVTYCLRDSRFVLPGYVVMSVKKLQKTVFEGMR